MIKKVLSTLLILSIILICPMTAFASVASSSNAERIPVASGSNASQVFDDFIDDFQEFDSFDVVDSRGFMSSGDDIDANTVDYGFVEYRLGYYDMSSSLRISKVTLNDDGYGILSRPSDFASFAFLQIYLSPGALPTPGKYSMDLHFGSNTGGFTYDNVYLVSRKSYNNASLQTLSEPASIIQSSGDISFYTTIDVGSGLYDLFLNVTSVSGLYLPWGGYTTIKFTRLSSNTNVDYGTAGGPQTTDDIQSNIADNTAQQVEQGDTIIELIKNTIQTISSQLTSFWNQLAGEFTNLYNKMNTQHAEQLEADRTNTEDMIAAEESNTTNIINNNNANTDKLADGYDNSGMQEDNGRLDSALKDYASQEDQVINQAKDKIDGFDYGINFDRLTAPMADISYFLTGIYNGLESLNIPIAFALTLSVALLAIGYYRFKGGA